MDLLPGWMKRFTFISTPHDFGGAVYGTRPASPDLAEIMKIHTLFIYFVIVKDLMILYIYTCNNINYKE